MDARDIRDNETKRHYREWCAAAIAFYPKLESRLRQGEVAYVTAAVMSLIFFRVHMPDCTRQLTEGMRGVRAADACRLKELTGMLASTAKDALGLSKNSKTDRGFNHPTLGRLLIPVKHYKVFDRDPTGCVHYNNRFAKSSNHALAQHQG